MLRWLALSLILSGVFILQVSAQTLLVNDQIPDDLLITLKGFGSWGFGEFEIKITSKGDFSSEYKGLPVILEGISIDGKSAKPPKYLKPKLSKEKLRQLIAEFEKIQFFKFGKTFPREDEETSFSISDAGTETISIRINGQTKEVSNYLGDSTKRSRMLRDLAEKIRGAGVWNYENGAIPKNFEVWYRVTDGDKVRKDFKINALGVVTETIYENRFYPQIDKELPVFIKSETVGKLSKSQLRQLIDEFEKAGFSAFRHSILDKYSGCASEPNPTLEKRTHINVQINHTAQMYASLYENCSPQPETQAAKFEYVNEAIKSLLKNIGVKM